MTPKEARIELERCVPITSAAWERLWRAEEELEAARAAHAIAQKRHGEAYAIVYGTAK